VSFICSSNNNIPRIAKMLEAIRREYGEPLGTFRGRALHSFPSLEALKRRATEQDLRRIGLGYRAKYVVETAKLLDSLGGEPYLRELRGATDPDLVQARLVRLRGVGRKVADCVALFSLRQAGAIPVDVHVWNIARRDYGADDPALGAAKSVTPKVYAAVGDVFRSRFGPHSGWAHSLLFVAELPSFRPVLPEDLVNEMDRFRAEEKARKG
jgi:N-glycosylase/DNA lyase